MSRRYPNDIKPRNGESFNLGPCDLCGVTMRTPVKLLPQKNHRGEFVKNKIVHPRCPRQKGKS